MNTVLAFKLLDESQLDQQLSKDRERSTTDPTRPLRCTACGQPVTDADQRTDRGGAHTHCVTNPLGLEFRIGCFSKAPGCTLIGEATTEHTWFADHAWRIALCRRCGTHLGWGFSATGDEGFFGLILQRLTESR